MIGRVKSLLGLGSADAVQHHDPKAELRLAAACLLVEASMIDGEVDERETERLSIRLAEHFEMEPDEVRPLVDKAGEVAADAVDWNRFTRVLKAEFEIEERITMLEMLWEVVLADGELHAYEDSLVRRIAGLLHVEDHDRATARHRAEARLAQA